MATVTKCEDCNKDHIGRIACCEGGQCEHCYFIHKSSEPVIRFLTKWEKNFSPYRPIEFSGYTYFTLVSSKTREPVHIYDDNHKWVYCDIFNRVFDYEQECDECNQKYEESDENLNFLAQCEYQDAQCEYLQMLHDTECKTCGGTDDGYCECHEIDAISGLREWQRVYMLNH